MNDANTRLADAVRTIRSELTEAGWIEANAVGEQKTPDGIVWFSSTYTSGEYTVVASYRPSGAGLAEGVTRIRITPQLLERYPDLAIRLSQDLVQVGWWVKDLANPKDAREYLEDPASWPPQSWEAFAL